MTASGRSFKQKGDNMKRTAIYLRVSSDKQVQEGDSIAAQRDALLKYIRDRDDLTLAGEYLDDGISGTKADRTELQRMLSDAEDGKLDLIIVTKLDRLHRGLYNFLTMQRTLYRCHVDWLAIWEPIYDTSTPQGRLIINQMMSIAQFEAENTGQRVRQVQAHMVTQGRVISGTAPHGYKIEGKRLVPDECAESVVAVFKTYAKTGSLSETMRLTEGLPGLPRYKAAFKTMLKNTKYMGEFRGNPDFCTPIIDRELFEAVQNMLKINVKASQKHDYIFTGLLVCADCGRHLGGNTRRRTRKNCHTIEHQYRCPSAYNPVRQCNNRKVVCESSLEKQLMTRIRPDIEDILLTAEVQAAPVRDNTARIKTLEKKLDRLKDLFLAELITIDEYKADKERISADIETLKVQQPEVQKDLSALRNLMNSGIELTYWDMSPKEKRRFWRGIVQKITFDHNRNFSVFYL